MLERSATLTIGDVMINSPETSSELSIHQVSLARYYYK